MSSGSEPATTVTLPAGVTVGAGRETSEVDAQGIITQGMQFPIQLADGSSTSIFVPYAQLTDTATIRTMIAERAAAIMAIGT
jgi:hypothetical protein